MPHDKCPVCGEPKDAPTAWSFTCGYHLNSQNGCKNAVRIAIEQAPRIAELEQNQKQIGIAHQFERDLRLKHEKEIRELNLLLKAAHKAWDSDKDSRVGKLLHAALNKDFRYLYRPDLKDI